MRVFEWQTWMRKETERSRASASARGSGPLRRVRAPWAGPVPAAGSRWSIRVGTRKMVNYA